MTNLDRNVDVFEADWVEAAYQRLLAALRRDADVRFGAEARFPKNEDQVDPVVQLLYRAAAHEFLRVDQRIQSMTAAAVEALGRRYLARGRMREPAGTVFSVVPTDDRVEFDPGLQFEFHRADRQVVFTTIDRLVARRVVLPIALVVDAAEVHLFRSDVLLGTEEPGDTERLQTLPVGRRAGARSGTSVYLPLAGALPEGSEQLELFLAGDRRLVDQLLCSRVWRTSPAGEFVHPSKPSCRRSEPLPPFVQLADPPRIQRQDLDVRQTFAPNFFHLDVEGPGLAPGRLPAEIEALGDGVARVCRIALGNRRSIWFRFDLDGSVASHWDREFRGLYANCAVATNASSILGNPLPAMPASAAVVPLDASCVQVQHVRDLEERRQYHDDQELLTDPATDGLGRYRIEFREMPDGSRRPMLRCIPPPGRATHRPLRLQIQFLRCNPATEANGIGPGEIHDGYQDEPRIEAAANVVATTGGWDHTAESQSAAGGGAAAFRSRGRLVSLQDFVEACSFAPGTPRNDPRVVSAECHFEPMRTARGILHGMRVELLIDEATLGSRAEAGFLAERLRVDLQSRALANLEVRVSWRFVERTRRSRGSGE